MAWWILKGPATKLKFLVVCDSDTLTQIKLRWSSLQFRMCENNPVYLRNPVSFPQFNTAAAAAEPCSSVQLSKDHHTGAARCIYTCLLLSCCFSLAITQIRGKLGHFWSFFTLLSKCLSLLLFLEGLKWLLLSGKGFRLCLNDFIFLVALQKMTCCEDDSIIVFQSHQSQHQ